MKLIQLSIGRWVDPQTVTAVMADEQNNTSPYSPDYRPRVTVHAGDATTIIDCVDFTRAQQAADELAHLVNVALTPGT